MARPQSLLFRACLYLIMGCGTIVDEGVRHCAGNGILY